MDNNRSRVRSVFELDVYKRSYELSLAVHQATLLFPKIEQYGGLADQMRRASKSICANLAEGWGKYTSADERRRYTRIALGSATEMQVWVRYAVDLEYIKPVEAEFMTAMYEEVARMLYGLVRPV